MKGWQETKTGLYVRSKTSSQNTSTCKGIARQLAMKESGAFRFLSKNDHNKPTAHPAVRLKKQ